MSCVRRRPGRRVRGALLACGLVAALSVVALAGGAGCATVAPAPSLEAARIAVDRAEDAGARRHAPDDLARARERLEQAGEAARSRSDWIEARRLAEKAEADAELALERTRTEKVRVSLAELRRSLRDTGR